MIGNIIVDQVSKTRTGRWQARFDDPHRRLVDRSLLDARLGSKEAAGKTRIPASVRAKVKAHSREEQAMNYHPYSKRKYLSFSNTMLGLTILFLFIPFRGYLLFLQLGEGDAMGACFAHLVQDPDLRQPLPVARLQELDHHRPDEQRHRHRPRIAGGDRDHLVPLQGPFIHHDDQLPADGIARVIIGIRC